MKRLVFISNMAAPYQVKFCYALQRHFDAEFWFHVPLEANRPAWWRVDLGDKCRLLPLVLFKRSRRYLSLGIYGELNRFNPDIALLGGFTHPTCYLAYRWAKRRARTVVMFTEVYRGRRRIYVRRKGAFTKLVHALYSGLDGVIAATDEAFEQFRTDFEFGPKVHLGNYPADIDAHLRHPLRGSRVPYTYLFANRLTAAYGPLLAIDVFAGVLPHQSGARLLMNASGELRAACEARARELSVEGAVEFLDAVGSWDELHDVYRRSDVLLFPAAFSTGNFTVVEAMASGMGVVISRRVLGTGQQLIQHGANGFLAEPSVEEFVECVLRYVREPVLLREHGRRSREIAHKYSFDMTARLFDELLNYRIPSARA